MVKIERNGVAAATTSTTAPSSELAVPTTESKATLQFVEVFIRDSRKEREKGRGRDVA